MRRMISACCSIGFMYCAFASWLYRKNSSGLFVLMRTMTMPTQTLAMVLAECSMLMARSVRTPLFMSARVPAPPSLCATTGQTTTSPRRRTPERTIASTAQMAATTPPLSSWAPIPHTQPSSNLAPYGSTLLPLHLHAGIHVAVQHQARPAARARKPRDGLTRLLAGLRPVGDLHHLHVEAEIGHVVGEMIGERTFLERGARDTDRGLLEPQDLLVADPRDDLLPVGGGHGRARSYSITNIWSVPSLSEM